jgi:type IV secretory pathway TrbF-like protein
VSGEAIDQLLAPALLLTPVRLPGGGETTFGAATEDEHRSVVRTLVAAGRPVTLDPMARRHAAAADLLRDLGAASLDAYVARRAV